MAGATAWDAVVRLEDKITDFITETRDVIRVQQELTNQLMTRQAILYERIDRLVQDLAVTRDSTESAHRRIDEHAIRQANQAGMRKGVVTAVSVITGLSSSGLVVAVVKLIGL